MAANALVQARIDREIKEEAAAVLATMGLTVSDAVRLLLTRIAHDHALPFNPLTPNEETIEAMREARRGNLPSVANVGEFLVTMNAIRNSVEEQQKSKQAVLIRPRLGDLATQLFGETAGVTLELPERSIHRPVSLDE